MILEEDIREKMVLDVANKMAIAARTAPKARGIDNISIAILCRDDIKKLSDKIKKMKEETPSLPQFFLRDAFNILSAQALLLLGTKINPMNLKPCSFCGFSSCAEKPKEHPCAFNTGDLGIAIGSAVSVAMDNRVDNRVMYTIGIAARKLGIFPEDVRIIYGIPLSVSEKNPFFDRK